MNTTDDDIKFATDLAEEALDRLRQMGDLAYVLGSLYDWAAEHRLDPHIVERLNHGMNAVNTLGGYCDCGGSSTGPCRSGIGYAVRDLIAATGLQLPERNSRLNEDPFPM